jgi:hypothetical protein
MSSTSALANHPLSILCFIFVASARSATEVYNPKCGGDDLFGTAEGDQVNLKEFTESEFTLKYAHWFASPNIPRIKDQQLIKANLGGLVEGNAKTKTYKESKHKCIKNFDKGRAREDFNSKGFGFNFKQGAGTKHTKA